jgi:hypothetical protein
MKTPANTAQTASERKMALRAANLRANLVKRKEQAKARETAPESTLKESTSI